MTQNSSWRQSAAKFPVTCCRMHPPRTSLRPYVRCFERKPIAPPQLCLKLFQYVSQMARETPLKSSTARLGLTLRQQKLVTLVAKGLTNKEIASHLNLSEFTVRNHLHRIMRQLKAGSRREAVEAVRAHAAAASVMEFGR